MFKPYSHSKLSSFVSCPQLFKFRYIDKIKPEFKPECFEKGISIHAELERYPKTKSTVLTEFLDSNVGSKYDKIMNGETQRELRIGLDSDFKLTKYSKTNIINGIIDMIYMKDGVVYLVDWKTGKVPQEQDWSQLEMYATAFLDKYPVHISYVYVDGKVERSRLYKPEQRQEIIDRIKQQIQTIEECKSFDRRITWKCKYCQYKEKCNPQDFGLENAKINIK